MADTAVAMNRDVNAVKALQHRAIRRLAALFSRERTGLAEPVRERSRARRSTGVGGGAPTDCDGNRTIPTTLPIYLRGLSGTSVGFPNTLRARNRGRRRRWKGSAALTGTNKLARQDGRNPSSLPLSPTVGLTPS
ncbi:hypothetical protein [Saccharopolyspora mangrovi]|uniref:hypothetical protein n=1 Tax=Saccharopolyspora mangrovi TaxID=3082379 RepID=UPI003899913B